MKRIAISTGKAPSDLSKLTYPVIILTACVATPDPVPLPPPFGQQADAQALLQPRTAAATTNDTHAGFRILGSNCHSQIPGQGNPLVHCYKRPIAGQPLEIAWTVNPTPPYETNRPAWLLVWFDEANPTDLTTFGYDNCTLWGPLNPKRMHALLPAAGSILTQQGGTVRLNWTPPGAWVGKRTFCQLAVASPGANAKGWLLSPALQLQIGSK